MAVAGSAAVKDLALYCCVVADALFLIRNSIVLDSRGSVLARRSLILSTA